MLWTSGTSSFDSTARSHWGSNLRKTTQGAKLSCRRVKRCFVLDVRYSSTRLRCQKSIEIHHNLSCLNWKYHFAENEVQAAGRAGAEGESAADPIADWSKDNHTQKESRERSEFAVFWCFLYDFMPISLWKLSVDTLGDEQKDSWSARNSKSKDGRSGFDSGHAVGFAATLAALDQWLQHQHLGGRRLEFSRKIQAQDSDPQIPLWNLLVQRLGERSAESKTCTSIGSAAPYCLHLRKRMFFLPAKRNSRTIPIVL